MRTRSEALKKKAKPQKSDRKRRQEEEEEKVSQREYLIDVPNDPANEQMVLAAMMADTETCDRLLPIIPTEAMYAEEHRIILEGLREMRRKKLTFDPVILARIAPDADIRILEQLPAARPDVPTEIDHFVTTLLWDFRRAQSARGPGAAYLDALQDPTVEPARMRAIARLVGESFEGDVGRGRHLRDTKEVIRQMMAKLRQRIAGEAYYPFGIYGLDRYEDETVRLRPGANPGTITLVSALSGSGKSTFISHLAINQAAQKRKVLFGAWEENAPTTMESLTTLKLGWSRSRVLDAKSNRLRTEGDDDWAPMTHEDEVEFEEAAHELAPYIRFFDNPFQRNAMRGDHEPTNDDHLDIIQEHLEESVCDVFIADLLARAMVDDRPSAEKHFLYRTMAILEETKVHGLFAHQQRAKDIETRANKTPTREGIIGSGAWLDTPTTVLAPHIPAKWKNVPDNTFEVHVLKQRNGPWPIGIEFGWNPDTGQITGGRSFNTKTVGETSDPAFGEGKVGVKKKPSNWGSKGKRGR